MDPWFGIQLLLWRRYWMIFLWLRRCWVNGGSEIDSKQIVIKNNDNKVGEEMG